MREGKKSRGGNQIMKEARNFILLVDYHRQPKYRRNTAGRYRVCAKTPKEAVQLLRKKLGLVPYPRKITIKEHFD